MLTLNDFRQILQTEGQKVVKETYSDDVRYLLVKDETQRWDDFIFIDRDLSLVCLRTQNNLSSTGSLTKKDFNDFAKELEAAVSETVTRKYTIFHYTKDEILDWALKHLDCQKVIDAVNHLLNVRLEPAFHMDVQPNGSTYSVKVESKTDLTELNPTLSAIFKEAHLESFGSWVSLNNNRKIQWSFDLDLRYEHFHGGWNGLRLLRVTVTENETTVIWEGNK